MEPLLHIEPVRLVWDFPFPFYMLSVFAIYLRIIVYNVNLCFYALSQKLIAFVMKLIDKMDIHIGSKSNGKRVMYFLLAMFLIGASVYLFKLILN